jgi:hypothetical protein
VAGSGAPVGGTSEENVPTFDAKYVVKEGNVPAAFVAKFGTTEESAQLPVSPVTPAKFRKSEVMTIPVRLPAVWVAV